VSVDAVDVTIRPASVDDFDAVLAFWDRSRSLAAVTPDNRDVLARLLDRSPDALLLAELEGTLVGTLIAAWDGWRGGMYRLAVAEALRRRGIGRRLVETGQARLFAKGARRINALLGSDEPEAAAFWTALGYEHDAKIARYVRNL
jgi:ribosomal protein S18 acetylase RimI-like enzyme